MLRVTGCVMRNKFRAPNTNPFAIIRNVQLIFRHGQEIAPQRLHSISIDARCAGDQLFRVEHVRCADRVHINLRALSGKPARRARMIEVDVREQDVSHITGG
ncbi:MAG: hypothetical protein CNIPEHKO_03553 [Anaerolineales bacterium]|nr:hypothetical protein [Anaerolineales bacterium]